MAVSVALFCVATGWTAARHEWGPTVLIGLAGILAMWRLFDMTKTA